MHASARGVANFQIFPRRLDKARAGLVLRLHAPAVAYRHFPVLRRDQEVANMRIRWSPGPGPKFQHELDDVIVPCYVSESGFEVAERQDGDQRQAKQAGDADDSKRLFHGYGSLGWFAG